MPTSLILPPNTALTTVEQILEDVSYALLEAVVNTTLGTAVVSGPGVVVQPVPMIGIYVGAYLLVGVQGQNQEQVTVTAVTATTFTATFLQDHASTDPVVGATFPSGLPEHQLLTQDEMIAYIIDVQNDFLLKAHVLYDFIVNVPFFQGNRFYPQPALAMRVERIVVNGLDLDDVSQSDLDLEDPNWQASTGVPGQSRSYGKWFQDQIDTGQIGIFPLPSQNGFMDFWFSVRGQMTQVTLISNLTVPDICAHAVKYGVLNRVWSKDGETHDPDRASYCKKRFDFIIKLAAMFMANVGMQVQKSDVDAAMAK